jgi:hypothetical protein
MMELLSQFADLIKNNPTAVPFLVILVMWWFERTERKDLSKINFDLQGKLLKALNDTNSSISQGNTLLQTLITVWSGK